jgi:hypothetical protein
MSAQQQEPTSAIGQALTHAHAGAAEQHALVQQAVSGKFARDFEWGDVDSTSSGFSFSDSETDFCKAVTAGATSFLPFIFCNGPGKRQRGEIIFWGW